MGGAGLAGLAVVALWASVLSLIVPSTSRAQERAQPAAARRLVGRLTIPRRADQLLVVSSPTDDPAAPGYLVTLRAYARLNSDSSWRLVFGPWRAETGSGHLVTHRFAGDHATPVGVFGIGPTMYGVNRDPGGLHYPYHRLVCGDWWDEDPFSSYYNQFIHVRCNVTPGFAEWSEALWTERVAYTYFAVVRFNMHPTVVGLSAPGAGIFLHNWVGSGTEGCIALHEAALLRILRWLKPSARPMIAIGTNTQVLSAGGAPT